MICEMCGAEAQRLKRIAIEGSSLNVCAKCVKFGQDHTTTTGKEAVSDTTTINERLERREKRLKTRDVFERSSKDELALDYPERIRMGRASEGFSQGELGKKINEKKSVVAKLETGNMVPDDKLVKKLEKTLGISLTEKVSGVPPPKHRGQRKSMTLGDFIKVERE